MLVYITLYSASPYFTHSNKGEGGVEQITKGERVEREREEQLEGYKGEYSILSLSPSLSLSLSFHYFNFCCLFLHSKVCKYSCCSVLYLEVHRLDKESSFGSVVEVLGFGASLSPQAWVHGDVTGVARQVVFDSCGLRTGVSVVMDPRVIQAGAGNVAGVARDMLRSLGSSNTVGRCTEYRGARVRGGGDIG